MPTLHLLALPHTVTSSAWSACAYTAKTQKFAKMFADHPDYNVIHYGNEGSTVPCEHVEIFEESTRAAYYGKHDPSKPYGVPFDSSLEPWAEWNLRAIYELRDRVQKGDFILTLCGVAHQPIGDAFPGSYSGTAGPVALVEYGIGYYGTFSRYRIFESNTHREWMHGRADQKQIDWDDACIPNYFDLDEFTYKRTASQALSPYFLFVGRIQDDKGWRIAAEVAGELGVPLYLAGQGDPGPLPDHVKLAGAIGPLERDRMMTNAVATFAPTLYREPFGGVAVEAQICGTPCITTDHGAFVENNAPEWRCTMHREFVAAAKRAQRLNQKDRDEIRRRARAKYSLEAVRPMYERYFGRLSARWGQGYYDA